MEGELPLAGDGMMDERMMGGGMMNEGRMWIVRSSNRAYETDSKCGIMH